MHADHFVACTLSTPPYSCQRLLAAAALLASDIQDAYTLCAPTAE